MPARNSCFAGETPALLRMQIAQLIAALHQRCTRRDGSVTTTCRFATASVQFRAHGPDNRCSRLRTTLRPGRVDIRRSCSAGFAALVGASTSAVKSHVALFQISPFGRSPNVSTHLPVHGRPISHAIIYAVAACFSAQVVVCRGFSGLRESMHACLKVGNKAGSRDRRYPACELHCLQAIASVPTPVAGNPLRILAQACGHSRVVHA